MNPYDSQMTSTSFHTVIRRCGVIAVIGAGAVALAIVYASCIDAPLEQCHNDHSCPPGYTCTLDGQNCVEIGTCGDSILSLEEVCDDGNNISGDGCSRDCNSKEICGNGVVDTYDMETRNEQCDCGESDESGAARGGPECNDKPNNDEDGFCTSQCVLHCGNGELSASESCDGTLFVGGLTCANFNHNMGRLTCTDSCTGIDIENCIKFLEFKEQSLPVQDGGGMPAPDAIPPQTFTGVWGTAANDVWAVGGAGAILHHDGTNWTVRKQGVKTEPLYGVWGQSDGDIYAVGKRVMSNNQEVGQVLRFDDQLDPAKDVEVMNLPPGTPALHAVWGRGDSDVFAVGDSGTILRYQSGDPSGWQQMTSTVTEDLLGLWGTDTQSADDVIIAVGERGTILKYSWTSETWIRQQSRTDIDLHAVWGSGPDNVFAVGFSIDNFNLDTVILQYHDDNVGWWPIPWSVPMTLTGVWGSGPHDVFAVAGSGDILHYNGSAWIRLEHVLRSPKAIWGYDENIVIAGEGIYKHDGYRFVSLVPVHSGLDSGWFATDGDTDSVDVFAAGHTGKLLHYDGIESREQQAYEYRFDDVWGLPVPPTISDPTRYYAYAVGTRIDRQCGVIASYDGATWMPLLDNCWENIAFTGVWGAEIMSGHVMWFVGVSELGDDVSSHIFRIENQRFPDWMNVVEDVRLRDVWGTGDNDLYAFGERGTIVHWDGSVWTNMEVPTTKTILAMGETSSNERYAVGTSGTIMVLDDDTWRDESVSELTDDLHSVWGTGMNDLFLVGTGAVWHKDNIGFTPVSARGLGSPRFIGGASAQQVYFVSEGGIHRLTRPVFTSEQVRTKTP